jgi:hypothetical protein
MPGSRALPQMWLLPSEGSRARVLEPVVVVCSSVRPVWRGTGMTGRAAPIAVTVKDITEAGKARGAMALEDIDSGITLRELIRTQVREEVARYSATLTGVFQGLVMPDGARPAPG